MSDAVDVYSAYGNQMEQLFESGRSITATALQPIKEELSSSDDNKSTESSTGKIISIVSDTADVNTPRVAVIEVFAWATITVTASMIGTFMGYTIFSPIMISIAEKFNSCISSYLLLPLIATLIIRIYDRNPEYCSTPYKDADVRYVSMVFAILQGMFNGRVIRNIYISAQPPQFLTPAAIAISFTYMPKDAGRNRVALLSSSLGFATAINILYGAMLDMLTLPYYSLTICYVAVAGIMLQFAFLNIQKRNSIHVHQHWLVSNLITIKGLFFLLFGSFAYT
ncbi:hypothetical protein DICVIV_03133 [Dictyocaulus viviparus]|uniref:Uncharacterized protein n=1 Tax=Dictyocaulus viviparus TaxID=29172 RepID=A0A0D8Y1I6_DICVI|nr:hypothetical protein DICVIV_03133 [Dictyocaulus viviparus]